jgi:hypothetical protein
MMPSPPSTRPSDARERPSSRFDPKQSTTATSECEPSIAVQTSTERAPSWSSRKRTCVAPLRTAGPRAAERVTLEIETLGAELAAATARLNDLQVTDRPIRITKKLVDDTIAQFDGILGRAPLETRVATVRDLFERVDVDSRELKAVAVWNMTTDQGVNPVGRSR